MKFHSRTDVVLVVCGVVGVLFCTLIMIAALSIGRYGLACFDLMLALVNAWVFGSAWGRREPR